MPRVSASRSSTAFRDRNNDATVGVDRAHSDRHLERVELTTVDESGDPPAADRQLPHVAVAEVAAGLGDPSGVDRTGIAALHDIADGPRPRSHAQPRVAFRSAPRGLIR